MMVMASSRVVASRFRGARLAMLLAFATACGSTSGEADSPADHDQDTFTSARSVAGTRGSSSVPTIEAEVGALDEEGCKLAFAKARPAIDQCLEDGRGKLPFIEGQMEVFVRVSGDGSTAFAYPRKATFGHRATERCVVDAIAAQHWPKPAGGREGETTQYLSIETHERRPLDWSGDDLGRNGRKLTAKLKRCMSQHGANSLDVTLYIDPDGRVMAAGASSPDEDGRDALQCAADAPKGMRFKSPGSYPAKVTFSL